MVEKSSYNIVSVVNAERHFMHYYLCYLAHLIKKEVPSKQSYLG